MAAAYRFISLVLCDDCRREENGKEILIGTYTGSIISGAVPFIMPTFAVRFEILPSKKEHKTAVVMKNPRGEDLFRIDGILAIPETEQAASFFYRVSPLIITMTGEHSIYLGMDDAEPEKVGTIQVLLQKPPAKT